MTLIKNMLSKTLLVLTLSTSALFAENATLPPTAAFQEKIRTIINYPEVKKALGGLYRNATYKLSLAKELNPFTIFCLKNNQIFERFPDIGMDFMEQVTETMPLESILSNFGLSQNQLTTTKKNKKYIAQDSPEVSAAKDSVITALLRNAKLNTLANMLSMGIGYLAATIYASTNNPTSAQQTTEELLEKALRYALKNNLSHQELKNIEAFSCTKAFKILIDNFDNFKQDFLADCEKQKPGILEEVALIITEATLLAQEPALS